MSGQNFVQARIVAHQASAGEEVTANPVAAEGHMEAAPHELPLGWERRYDPKSGREYFLHRAMHKTQWERPSVTI